MPVRISTRVAAIACLAPLLAGASCLRPALAQDAPGADIVSPETDPATARQNLKQIEDSITLSKQKLAQLREQIANMSGDQAKQSAALVAAGERVKLAEIETDASEDKLNKLRDEEDEIRGRLSGARSSVTTLLAALQAISSNPPPALIVNPRDALSSARGAIVLADILPQLKSRADAVAADLGKLVAVREKAETQMANLKANLTVLSEERLRIATLIQARRAGMARANADLEKEQKRAEALAEQAKSLKDLIASLSASVPAVGAAAEAAKTAAPETGAGGGAVDAQSVNLALANTSRTAPAFPISRGKGFLTAPAAGVTVTGFGDEDGFGGISQGLSVVTRADAQVVAPADGWVMYKGPYLDYGQIVILNPGQGYSILLAGLDKLDVQLGQFVLLGEPVGQMGEHTVGTTVATSAGVSRPTLYIELRDKNGPIDPSGWWANDQEQTKNG